MFYSKPDTVDESFSAIILIDCEFKWNFKDHTIHRFKFRRIQVIGYINDYYYIGIWKLL